MRNCLRALLVLIFFSAANETYSQSGNELIPGYYITVAAYDPGKEDYAIRYVEQLKSQSIEAKYGFNSSRNYYFVYLEYFTDLRESIKKMLAVRAEGKFTDAWVRVVSGKIEGSSETVANQQSSQSKPTETPATEKKATVENTPKTETQEVAEKKSEPVKKEEPVPQPKSEEEIAAELIKENVVDTTAKIIHHDPMTLGNTEVFLSLFNASNNRVVEGKVQVIDTEKAKLIKEVDGNDYLTLDDPKSKTGKVTLIADVFGYRKVQHEIDYNQPLKDTVKRNFELMGTTFVVFFDLVRYRKGDIRALYNVYFFNDAAMMMPESKYELNSLLEMLNENPRYRIRLHGHTNGNYHGRILSLGPDKELFTINGATNTVGSAKDLSRQRAESIRLYLIQNGIAEDRIEIKAWGGKRPIYDKHSANARRNVRVEVEILQE